MNRPDFVLHTDYFCGNKVSDYGLQYNRVDYATLAKAFDAVLANDIMSKTYDIGDWEQINGFIDNSDEISELQDELSELENIDEPDSDVLDRIAEINDQISELEDQEAYPDEVYQWYIISSAGAELLQDYTDEIIYYNYELDLYLWGVTHYGTSWAYVLTNIRIKKEV